MTARSKSRSTPAPTFRRSGSWICRPVSECQLALLQGEGHTPVVLGQPGDAEALLGVVTLQILGLVFDPFRRTLQPMRTLLV